MTKADLCTDERTSYIQIFCPLHAAHLSFLPNAHSTQPISPYFCFIQSVQSYLAILRAAYEISHCALEEDCV